jgi:hypothetical protein
MRQYPFMSQFIRLSTLLVLVMTLSAYPCPGAAKGVLAKGQRKLDVFDYQGVTLDGGRLRLQLDEIRDYYLRIPNDDLLKGFRQRAKKPAPGENLGGWYSSDTFHVFGQILSGLARLFAATGDAACKDKVDALVSEWGKCIAADGYFYYSAKPNAPHYTYDKMVGGLVDAYLYCGNREAIGHLRRITDWAVENLDRSRRTADTSTEWYTLSENLYRAYLATGDPVYRDFAEVWEYHEYWDIYARKADLFAPRPSGQRNDAYHAYSHVNTLGGAGAAYLVKGDPRYLDILMNAYDSLQANQIFVTGGYGPDEQLLPRDKLRECLENTTNTFETQCGTWAGFKMAKHLLCATRDAKYGDWVEGLALNGIGASIPMSADGRVFYYSDYNPHGGEKHNTDFGWSCCTGTRPQAAADCCDLVYFKDEANLYVNLFTPSTVHWSVHGKNVTLRQTTRFPEESKTRFMVELAQPVTFGLRIRCPAWLAGPITARVNGSVANIDKDSQNWAAIERTWRSGDQLDIELPMRLKTSSFAGRRYPAALLFGPVALAVRAASANFAKQINLDRPEKSLVLARGEPLTWRLAADSAVLVRPFYAYKEGEPYYLYFDPAAANRISHRSLSYQGGWNNGSAFHFTNSVGAIVECSFRGTGIRWLGFRFDDAGKAEVSIDGKVVATVDQYGAGRNLPFDWSQKNLKHGSHTIRLRLLDEKLPQSKGRFINVAGFDAINE